MLTIYEIGDGKPGHENQIRGLSEALSRRIDVDRIKISPLSWRALIQCFFRIIPSKMVHLPFPDLMIGAGHSTHMSLWALRRLYSAPNLVLMKPSLPLSCFNLCFVPWHDGAAGSQTVELTQGVLNAVCSSTQKEPVSSLILIGGPSAHVDWSTADVMKQIESIMVAQPGRQWRIVASRRTPLDVHYTNDAVENRTYYAADQLNSGKCQQLIEKAEQIWVTADSVSMVFEALSSGAQVGLIELPIRAKSRIGRGVEQLIRNKQITCMSDWLAQGKFHPVSEPLQEATRCADAVLRRWFNGVAREQ